MYPRFIAIETFKLTSLEGSTTLVKEGSIWESLSSIPYASDDTYWPLAEIKKGKLSQRQIKIPIRLINNVMRQVNPIKSPEQYGLMQAVASGAANVKGITKKVAKKLIHETPAGLRREFAKMEAKTRKHGNPDSAEELTQEFHGRPSKETVDITESESYDSDLAQLGELTELEIVTEDGEDVIPISFSRDSQVDVVRLCSTPNGRQLEFIGGDQSLELDDFEEAGLEIETGKREVAIGPVHSISYWTDKHHLAGSKDQEQGVEFIHEFSEESGGSLPMLVYDTEDEKMRLVGGRYRIEAEGIKD